MPDSTYERITAEPHPDDDRIFRVLLDSPERHNVIDLEMLFELRDAFERADRDESIQAIILGTAADVFCSGADLNELKALNFEDGTRWLTTYIETIEVLRETGKPAIAAVEGVCVAGGNELTMACDLVVAGDSARFGQPEVGVGSTAAGGGVQMLPLLVGEKRARELLLTGDLLDAEEAERIGLINRVVSDDVVAMEAFDLAREIIENKSPQAYRTIKAMMKTWTNLAMLNQEVARDVTAAVWASDEFRERATAFLDREDPAPRPFTGTRPVRDDDVE